jgi:DNA-binding FadR family transcriptional regulator
MAGELAAQRITPGELAEIQAMQFEMMAAYTRRDLSPLRVNARIHGAISAAAKNPVLATVLPAGGTAGCRPCASAPTRTARNGSAP